MEKIVTVMEYCVVRVGKGQCNELCFIVGKILTVIVYCVVGVGKGQCNDLCFKVGKIVTVMLYCVVRVGKGQCNELCFIVGKIVTVMVYCVVMVGEGQRNELCFKTACRNCECKCANVTSSDVRLSLVLFQNVQLEKKLILILFPFATESMTICSPH